MVSHRSHSISFRISDRLIDGGKRSLDILLNTVIFCFASILLFVMMKCVVWFASFNQFPRESVIERHYERHTGTLERFSLVSDFLS